MTQNTTRQELADVISQQFTVAHRPDGTAYTTAADDTMARDLVRDVHFQVFDGMLPDDWVYEQTRAIVNLYAEDDNQYESAYELADDMTSDLLTWAGNGIFRGFINKALPEFLATYGSDMSNVHLDSIIIAGQEAALRDMEWHIGQWLDDHTA